MLCLLLTYCLQHVSQLVEELLQFQQLQTLVPLLRKIILTCVFDKQLALNAVTLFRALPPHSPLRRPVLHFLAKQLQGSSTIGELERRLGVGRTTIFTALRGDFAALETAFGQRYPSGVKRPRTSPVERDILAQLITAS